MVRQRPEEPDGDEHSGDDCGGTALAARNGVAPANEEHDAGAREQDRHPAEVEIRLAAVGAERRAPVRADHVSGDGIARRRHEVRERSRSERLRRLLPVSGRRGDLAAVERERAHRREHEDGGNPCRGRETHDRLAPAILDEVVPGQHRREHRCDRAVVRVQVERRREDRAHDDRRARRAPAAQLEPGEDERREDPRVHEAAVAVDELAQEVGIEGEGVGPERGRQWMDAEAVQQRVRQRARQDEPEQHEEVDRAEDPRHRLHGPDEQRLQRVGDGDLGGEGRSLRRAQERIALRRERVRPALGHRPVVARGRARVGRLSEHAAVRVQGDRRQPRGRHECCDQRGDRDPHASSPEGVHRAILSENRPGHARGADGAHTIAGWPGSTRRPSRSSRTATSTARRRRCAITSSRGAPGE